MNELEPLATELRRALGAPPDAWRHAQRERLRGAFGEKERRPVLVRFAPLLVAACVLTGALAWIALRDQPPAGLEHQRVARDLRGSFRFDDGSSIALGPDGHGRLVAEAGFVRFDLERGRATFDVTPGQQRAWTITAGRNEVKVLGTRFSVSYALSEEFAVDVERGSVSVRVPERSASVELKAGDRLRGRPGHMTVAHGASAELPPAAAPPEPETTAPGAKPPTPPAPRSTAPGEAEHLAEWRARYRDGKYAESLALLRAGGVAGRLHELPPGTLAEVADAARLGGDLDLAVRALRVLMQQFPRAPEARDGKFLLGRVHALRGDGAAATAAFEEYLKPGGSTQYSNEAVGRLMELYAARGADDRARAMARRYLESAPDGPYRRLARSLVQPQR